MIKICTTYFEGMYTPDYVGKLYRSIKRNTSIPFEFICLSDNKDVEADVILPYNHHSKFKIHWHKLKYFSSIFANQKPGDEIIIMDIDQVIVGNLDDMIGWPVEDNELVTYNSWWNKNLPINGGWYKFKSGTLNFVWDEFCHRHSFWQNYFYEKGIVHHNYYGEQNYVYMIMNDWINVRKNKGKITLMPPEWLGKYQNDYRNMIKHNQTYSEKFNTDYMILDKPHPNLKVVHFAGTSDSIHNSKEPWLKEFWR